MASSSNHLSPSRLGEFGAECTMTDVCDEEEEKDFDEEKDSSLILIELAAVVAVCSEDFIRHFSVESAAP